MLYDLGFEGLDQVNFLIGNIHAGIETIDPTSIGVPRRDSNEGASRAARTCVQLVVAQRMRLHSSEGQVDPHVR